jgi:hypothetical protein
MEGLEMKMKRTTTDRAYSLLVSDAQCAVDRTRPAMLIQRTDENGLAFTAARFNGRDHLHAAIEMLKVVAGGKDVPPRVAHHVDQAICELRQAVKNDLGRVG